METIKNNTKKILKKIVFLITIIILSLSISAEYLYTSDNPAPYIIGYYLFDGYTSNNQKATVRVFPHNYNSPMSLPIDDNSSKRPVSFLGLWNSNIKYNTIYKITLDIDITNSTLDTGIVPYQSNTFFSIVPGRKFYSAINMEQYAAPQYELTLSYFDDYALIYYDPDRPTAINQTYHMFYDSTSKQLSVIFCVLDNVQYYETIEMFDNYFFIALGENNYNKTTNITITEYTGKLTQDTYSDVLNEISNKLDSLANSGGMTQEQLNQAIQDALTAHDQQLEQEVSGKLDQILEQINGITEPYTEAFHDVMGTLDNFRNIFEYSGFVSNITFPAATNPLAGNAVLWEAKTINLAKAFEDLPSVLKTAIKTILRALVYIAALREVINIIRYAVLGLKGGAED